MTDLDAQRWDEKYAGRANALSAVGSYLPALEDLLPTSGPALDVAGGTGRHALWLAQRGLTVTLVDVSSVAVERARSFARQQGLQLDARTWDLDTGPPPGGPWSLILCTHFFDPTLMKALCGRLAAGGVVVWVHPTVVNLERNAKPSRRFLAQAGQVATILRDASLEMLHDVESWVDDGDGNAQHLAVAVGRATRGS